MIELIGKLKRILVRKPLIVSIWEYRTPMTDTDKLIQELLRGNVITERDGKSALQNRD